MAASDSDSVASTDGRSSSLTDMDTSTSESTSESSDSAADPADTDGVLQLKSHVPLTSHAPMPSFSVQDAPSDKSSCSNSSDTSSTTSRSAARPRIIKIKRLLESSQQHLSRHADVAIRQKCQRCKYYSRCQELQHICSWILPTTDEKCTWLMEHPGAETGSHEWGLGCRICRWAGLDTKMARCRIQTIFKLDRHQKSQTHKRAVQRLLETQIHPAMGGLVAEASSNPPPGADSTKSASNRTSTGGETPGSHIQPQETQLRENVSYGQVIKMLEVFQEQNSITSFERAIEAGRIVGSDINPGNGSRKVGRNLVTICARREIVVNRSLLRECTVLGLGQDGRDSALLVASRMVMWRLPNLLRRLPNLPNGVTPLLPDSFGKRGPWIVERVLGCGVLGSHRSGKDIAKSTLQVLRQALPSPDDFEAVAKKARFFTADNAADETIAHKCLSEALGGSLEFDIPDLAHSVMLAIKNGCKGDTEVDLVRAVFLTNKRPTPSISRCLQNSSRFRSQFTEEQQDGIETTVSHLGFAPQRFSSQSRPWGRGARKIRDLMSCLAKEVDNGGQYKKACLYNLRTIAPFGRMVLAGLLGDLTAEHSRLVHIALLCLLPLIRNVCVWGVVVSLATFIIILLSTCSPSIGSPSHPPLCSIQVTRFR